jgi:hypothetical protein
MNRQRVYRDAGTVFVAKLKLSANLRIHCGDGTIFNVNPAALYFASGDSLYPGSVLLLTIRASADQDAMFLANNIQPRFKYGEATIANSLWA